jgi:hypothetical protein
VGEHDLELNALRIIWSTLRREIALNLGSALAGSRQPNRGFRQLVAGYEFADPAPTRHASPRPSSARARGAPASRRRRRPTTEPGGCVRRRLGGGNELESTLAVLAWHGRCSWTSLAKIRDAGAGRDSQRLRQRVA